MNNVISLPTRSLRISLLVSDPEVLNELERRDDGAAREAFATQALRLGVLALRQASGSLDADVIRREGDQLLSSVGAVLHERTSELSSALAKTMQQYLDPTSGALPQRIEQLTKPNGDLERILGEHLAGDQSVIAQTLAAHVGETSPLFKLLSPTQSDGLLAAMTMTFKRALDGQRDEVLNQFSLDRKESALSRLLAEVTTSNGKLRSELAEDVGKVAHEFSLDNEDGALSRLVARVERAQETIAEEFSLDHEGSALQRLSSLLTKTSEAVETSLTLDDEASPLARLKREVLDVLDQHKAANVNFQTEVRSTLETFKTRREEAVRSPAHGNTFEAAVGEFLRHEAQGYGDLYEAVGTTKGQLDRKTGDHVLTLGAESGAPETRIVCEAKAKKGYTEREAIDEIARARKNRDAQIGLVVISRAFAPEGMSALRRVGNDLLVVWDSDDVASDLALRMAVSVARALCVRENVANSAAEASFDRIDQSIESIAEQIRIVDDIIHSARLVKRRGEKIGAGAEKLRATIEREVAALQDHVKALRKESE